MAGGYDRALSAEVAFRRRFVWKEIRARPAGHLMAAAALGGLVDAPTALAALGPGRVTEGGTRPSH